MEEKKLPAVIAQAAITQNIDTSKVNLLVPTETFGDIIGEFDRVTLEVVKVSSDPNEQEVYEIAKGKFAMGKRPLAKIASALGIVWDPHTTTILESSDTKSRAKATGAITMPNGRPLIVSDEKTVDLKAIEAELRIKEEEYAEKGKPVRWENNRPVNEPWSKHGGEEAKARYIDITVRKALISYMKFKDERAMTGAQERVVKKLVALKNTYTKQELEKPFVFPCVSLDTPKLLNDPTTRPAALELLTSRAASVFAAPTPEARVAQITDATIIDQNGNGHPGIMVDAVPAEDAFLPEDPFAQPPEDAPKAQDEGPRIKELKMKLEEFTHAGSVVSRNPGAIEQINALIAASGATVEDLDAMLKRCTDYSVAWQQKGKVS